MLCELTCRFQGDLSPYDPQYADGVEVLRQMRVGESKENLTGVTSNTKWPTLFLFWGFNDGLLFQILFLNFSVCSLSTFKILTDKYLSNAILSDKKRGGVTVPIMKLLRKMLNTGVA